MDTEGNDAQGTLCEIANEARKRAMHEWMERMERQMKTLTVILHELRDGQRWFGGRGLRIIRMSQNPVIG